MTRKAIAKCLTVLNEKRRDAAKVAHKGKKYTPRDLRWKNSTKASRKGLTTRHLRNLKTAKATKKANNNRMRKFAIAN